MIIDDNNADYIRDAFIETFIDQSSVYFETEIQRLKSFSDGLHYSGYLWECLINRKRVSFEFVVNFLVSQKRFVYIFWDNHSSDRILIPNYWNYSRKAVLKIDSDQIKNVIYTLPEDCYFFDETLSWAIALTHEEIKVGKRICFLSSVIS